MWYKRVRKFVIDSRGKILVTDPALFMWHENKNLIGFICVHVDNLCSGNEFFFNHMSNIFVWKRRMIVSDVLG